nr:4-coumarate--CoA ligase 1-like [Onthophagus taurus]
MLTTDEIVLPDQGDNIIRTKDDNFQVDPKGIGHELFVALKSHKGKLALIEADTGKEESYDDLLKKSIRIACHLKRMGITHNDIIVPCTTNHLNSSAVFHAILFSGAKSAGMDPFAPDADRTKQLQLVKPKLIFTIPESIEPLEKIIKSIGLNTKIVVFGKTDKHTSFDEFLIPLPEEEKSFLPYETNDVQETALIVFSSGTTGLPKATRVTHYSAMCIFGKGMNWPRQTYLSYSSFVWASQIFQTLSSSCLGGIKIQASGFEPEKTLRYLEKYKVTFLFLAPQDVISLIKHGVPKDLELPHLKFFFPVGGGLSIETIEKLRKMFPMCIIYITYGQTELWNASLQLDLSPKGLEIFARKPGSCGRPAKGSTYKVVDLDTGKPLGPNQPGELYVKSKTNTPGYYGEDKFDRYDDDGFLKTGDILYYDEDKWFYFVERHKEMLRYKMIAIAPSELEGILIQHPSVKLAAVIGKPTDEGDLATAVIVKKIDNVTAEELEALVAGKVDERKKLRGGVLFVDENEIPMTPTGKVSRRLLKQYILKKIEGQ